MSDLNVAMVRNEWLRTCGRCDAGLAMECTCPSSDHRTVIEQLCNQVERLQSDEARGRVLLDQSKTNAHAAVESVRVQRDRLSDLVDEFRKREATQDRIRERLTAERDRLRAAVDAALARHREHTRVGGRWETQCVCMACEMARALAAADPTQEDK